MSIIPRLIDGRLKCVEAEPTFWAGGYGYDGSGSLCVTRSAPTAGSMSNGGPLMTPSGRVHISYNAVADAAGGVPVDSAGRMACAEFGTIASGTNGLPTTAAGAVVVDTSSFRLSFADLGSGQVSLVPDQGGVAATFTRATTASTIGSTGLVLKGIASGVARAYYDPTTLAYQGYLAEGARTNICLQSEDLATTWTNLASTESTNSTTAPDGTTTADKCVEDNTTATHGMRQAITITADATYTFSVWAKADTRSALNLVFWDLGSNGVRCNFNLSTGAVGTPTAFGTGTAAAATATSYPGGWWRLTLTGNIGGGVTASDVDLRMQNPLGTDSYAGDAASGLYVWGAQLELGAFASSYIPTTTASVARNADVLTYPITGWFNATQGTLFAQGRPVATTGAVRTLLSIDDNTANEMYGLVTASGTNQLRSVVTDGGVGQAAITDASTFSAGSSNKYNLAYAANDFAASFNGSAVGTDTSGTLPTVTQMQVGCQAGALHAFGTTYKVAAWSIRQADAVLSRMST